MTLTEHPELIQGSEEWHDQRRGMVTASVVGRLITPKTIKAAGNPDSRSLMNQLVAERISGWTEPTYMNDDMMRGVMCEPIARDLYSANHAPATETGFMTRDDWGHPIGYSPDGLVGTEGLIEVKAPRAKTHIQTIINDEVPLHNVAQCQAGLLVSGRQWLDFISYCGGLPMYVKRVLPDPRWHEAIVAAVQGLEENASVMISAYGRNAQGLAQTERVIEMEMVI